MLNRTMGVAPRQEQSTQLEARPTAKKAADKKEKGGWSTTKEEGQGQQLVLGVELAGAARVGARLKDHRQ